MAGVEKHENEERLRNAEGMNEDETESCDA